MNFNIIGLSFGAHNVGIAQYFLSQFVIDLTFWSNDFFEVYILWLHLTIKFEQNMLKYDDDSMYEFSRMLKAS